MNSATHDAPIEKPAIRCAAPGRPARIIASIAIAASMPAAELLLVAGGGDGARGAAMAFPLVLGVLGVLGLLASLVGVASMTVLKRWSSAAALRYSEFLSAGLFLLACYATVPVPEPVPDRARARTGQSACRWTTSLGAPEHSTRNE